MFRNFVRIPPTAQLILAIVLVLSLFTTNPLFTFLAILFVPVAARLLWKKDEPPVLFLGMIFQWLQVVIKVFYADLFGLRLTQVTDYPHRIGMAFFLSLTALFVEAFGIFWIIRRYKAPPVANLARLSQRLDLPKVTRFYILFSLLIPVVQSVTPGGLAQFVFKLADLKWAVFFIFYLLTFIPHRRVLYFYIIIAVEIVLGFTGYFSSFKDFFLFAAISYLTISKRLSVRQYALITVSAVLLFNIMVVWQTVKGEYRSYLSGGVRAQIVTVSKSEALKVLYYRVSSLDKEQYRAGMKQLIDRISYIGFFSATQSYVPGQVPYENGRLWLGAITKIFTPRILFPNKEIIDDSQKTRKYTGREVAGAESGASISLGYVTESYIDFGPVFMFVPLFMFGLLIGQVYKFIVTQTVNQLFGYAFAIPVFFQLYTFELALDKAVGAIVAYFIVYFVVRQFVLPPVIKLISRRSVSNKRLEAPASHHVT